MSGIVEMIEDLRRRDVRLWLDGADLRVSAPPGVLTPALIAEIKRCKPELSALLRSESAAPAPAPIALAPRGQALPSSFAQQQLWVLTELGQGQAYHSHLAVRIEGPLDVVALERALGEIVCRHESLRTTFRQDAGAVLQCIAPPAPLGLVVHDLRGLAPEPQRTALAAQIQADSLAVIDLGRGPLLNGRLLRLADDEAILHLTVHHIAFDGWSLGVLARELDALYGAFARGLPSPLAALPLQYADYSVWQRKELSGPRLEREIEHWRTALRGAPTQLAIPVAETSSQSPGRPSQRAGTVQFRLGPEVADGLRRLSRSASASLFMTALAAFQVLLARTTGETDFVVGTPVANRDRRELESLIGYFVNTLALRTDLSGDPTFLELVKRVRGTTLTAFEHQALPFERLVEALAVERSPHRSPLVQVLFAVQNAGDGRLSLPGLRVTPFPLAQPWARMDLEVDLIEEGPEIACTWVYDRGRFSEAAMQRMAGHFQRLLTAAAADPGRRALDLPLLSADEQRALAAWGTSPPLPHEPTCLHSLFERQAAQTPDAIALFFDSDDGSEPIHLGYRALDEQANRLAHHLRALGVGPGDLVALYLPRSLDQVVAILGTHKAGGAYVPIDFASPPQRVDFLLKDSQAKVLVTHAPLAAALSRSGLPARLPEGRIVCIDTDRAALAARPQHRPEPLATPGDLAYVIYTSGSTGQPKGVQIEHRAVVAHVAAYQELHALTPADRVLMLAAYHFDASVEQLFPALAAGASVVISDWELAPEHFSRRLAARGVTLLDTSGAHWRGLTAVWLRDPTLMARSPLRTVVIGGDVMPADVLTPWWQTAIARRVQLFNCYGPTETTVAATVHRVQPGADPGARIPIGRPLPGRSAYVLDPRGAPVPVGVPGELHLGGSGLARGYLHRSELTREKFISPSHPDLLALLDPAMPDRRLYRTGDRARFLADGALDFLGRIDNQIKIRGYRIELEEIEAQLRQQPAVEDAAVLVHEADNHRSLVAYIATSPGPDPSARTAAIQAALRSALPEHMIPARFVLLPHIPRITTSGKVDRTSLPDPGAPVARTFVTPQNPVEASLAAIFAEVLGSERVGATDDFFSIGGHSLNATQVIARVNQQFAVRLPLQAIFEHSTPRELATRLDTASLARELLTAPVPAAGALDEGEL